MRPHLLPFVFANVLVASLAAGQTAQSTAPQSKEAERLNRAAEVFGEIMNAPDSSVPEDLLERAHCVVVIPSMIKGGFVFGGRYGKGVVSCRKNAGVGPWGPPAMVTLGGGSFGAQIGGAAVDVIMLVMNPSGVEKLLKSKFTVGGDLSAAAGPVGRAATAETDALLNAKILTYSRSRGVFAGAELKGAVLKQDRDGNRFLYRRRIEARDLLIDGKAEVPAEAQPFIAVLTKYSPQRTKKPL
ncbi:MAG: lipid-binding SYLF domain-containing protein [Terriglobia bacterium]